MYELSLKNHLDDLGILSDWLSDRAQQLGISQQALFRLQLVMEEVVSNTIQNAYVDTDEHTIAIQLSYQDHTICVSVTDDGIAFNPLEYPEAILPKSLEEAEIGGLGIHLMRHYTDACQYQRKNNVNILTMTIYDRLDF
jgi:serine/threonine-protein kinase RsbW